MAQTERKIFLLLIESKTHYEAYVSCRDTLDQHKLVICCLSVDAVEYCQIKGLEYIVPEDCYTDEESKKYQNSSEKKIRDLVKHLNDYYHKKIDSRDGFKFDMGNYHFFMLYHFFGALHHRAFFLSKILQTYNVERVLIPQEPKSKSNARPFPVSQYVNVYLDLFLNSIYNEIVIPIPVESVIHRSYSTVRTRIRSALGKTLRKIKFFNEYLNHVQNNIDVKPWSLILDRFGADILLIGWAGPWKYVFSDSRLKNRVSVFFETDEINLQRTEIRNWFSEWFDWNDTFCGFCVSDLGYFEMGRIKNLSERIVEFHNEALSKLKNKSALIYAVAPDATQQYLLSVAKHLGIPRICFQHGEMSLYYPGLWNEASELLYASHYFSFGNRVSQEKTSSAEGVVGFEMAISIGSPVLDKIRIETKCQDGYILYASSKYLDYSGGFNGGRYCDLHIKETQNLLIDYFEEYLELGESKKVIWKLNPERLTIQPTKTTKNLIVFRDEKTFVDLLTGASLVILDRPSTTSLEACMTDKPLFVLLPGNKWFQHPEMLLRKRAVVACTPKELLDCIDDYLKNGAYPADVNNREFVREYGCHKDDGMSAYRAVTELLKTIELKK